MTPSKQRLVVTTSWDDGHCLDRRLADLLDAFGIEGTFYIAPRNRELAPADRLSANGIKALGNRFEIGAHTLTHQLLPRISDAAAQEEVRAGRSELEDITGSPVTSFCYPCGQYTAAHVRFLDVSGFSLARTVKRSSLGTGPRLEMVTTVNAYAHRVDGPLALRMARMRPLRAAKLYLRWDDLALRWFDLALERGGVYHLWGHSWEVDARGDWARLRRVLAYISNRPDVVYATNRDVLAQAAS